MYPASMGVSVMESANTISAIGRIDFSASSSLDFIISGEFL